MALASALVVGLPATREAVLRFAGDCLVEEDAATRPDVVVMLSGGGPTVLLEAADLAREFAEARVMVFLSDPGPVVAEFARRGVQFPSESARQRELLGMLGVSPDRVIMQPATEGGTVGEVAALADWRGRHAGSRVVVLASWHHSARARRIIRRAFAGDGARPAVRIPALERQRAADWWRSRSSQRAALVELQKLAIDVFRHPLS